MDLIEPTARSSEWFCAFIGGLLIGAATTLNFGVMGRITGYSGILNSLVKFDFEGGFRWKV